MRDQVHSDYQRLEGEGEDTWNPIVADMQLGYRMAVLYALGRTLKISGVDLAGLSVVDIGCGNGRSTRAYQEFGLLPSQLHGLDFRPGAIAMAQRMHPAIRFDVQQDERLPLADASVNWVSLMMVLSSIRDEKDRRFLGDEIRRVLKPGGHLLYIDHVRASDDAGRGALSPAENFAPLQTVWSRQLRLIDVLPDAKLPPPRFQQDVRPGWRFGRGGGVLSWIPRPHWLGQAIKSRLPLDLRRWVSSEPIAFDIRLFSA